MFPDLKQDEKKPVLNGGTESGPGKGCSHYFSYFFAGNIWFSGNGIQERGPLYKTTNSRKFNVVPNIKARSQNSRIFLDHPQILFYSFYKSLP